MVTKIADNLRRVFNDTQLGKAKTYSLHHDTLNGNRIEVYGTYNRTACESICFPFTEYRQDGMYHVFTLNKTIKLILK